MNDIDGFKKTQIFEIIIIFLVVFLLFSENVDNRGHLDDYHLTHFVHLVIRACVGNLKHPVPISSESSKFKDETQHYVVKLPKSAGARRYCPKIQRVPDTLGIHANSSPEQFQRFSQGLQPLEYL